MISGYRGFLFIGSPHVRAKKPGRRKDHDFLSTVLGKLEQSLNIASKLDLKPIILGDLIDRHQEERVMVPLIRLLIDRGVDVLVGNHDKNESETDDNTSLMVLKESRVVRVIDDMGLVDRFELKKSNDDSESVALCAAPYSATIPRNVKAIKGIEDHARVILVTHASVDFGEGACPGALHPFEINGCELVVNGHMHDTKPKKVCGGTTWFNPGSITRLKVDERHHVPSAWSWTPDEGIIQHVLNFEPDIFDMTGRHVEEAVYNTPENRSIFVELLKAEESLEIERTDDGSVLEEEMSKVFADMGSREEVQMIVKKIHKSIVDKSNKLPDM